MSTFLAAALVLGIGVFGMCFNMIFRKKEFPKYDVGSNEEMKKIGIRCYKDEDAALHGKHCAGNNGDACKDCSFHESFSDSRTS